MRFIDCEGFAGGFAMGMVRSGFKLVAKREHTKGFGAPLMEGNRHLLGNDWEGQYAPAAEWEPVEAEVVAGNPPCSAFSTVTATQHRGMDSHINQCMWDFAGYVAKVKPFYSAMESVALAYSQGRELMQRLRTFVEEKSGLSYDLVHVLHSCAACGGAQVRKRYFMVLARRPFGVERPGPNHIPTIVDVIGDLVEMKLQQEAQVYPGDAVHHYQRRARVTTTEADGHFFHDVALTSRIRTLLGHVRWNPGENLEQVLGRAMDANHDLLGWGFGPRDLVNAVCFEGRSGGASRFAPFRMKPDAVAPVITGAAMQLLVHPTQDRSLTHREVARIQGFPDDWTCAPCTGTKQSSMWWGKGITVQAGEWIGKWLSESLQERPGSDAGVEIGERERLIDWTCDFTKPVSEYVMAEDLC